MPPVLNFYLIPDHRARRFGVHRRTFTTRVSQLSQWSGGSIAQRLESGLRHGVLRQALNGEEDDEDFLFVNMSSNRLHHAHQSHRVSVGEWHRNEEPVTWLFSKLSQILNSNEQFEMDDTFHLEVTHVRNPGRRSGKRKKWHETGNETHPTNAEKQEKCGGDRQRRRTLLCQGLGDN